MHKEIDSIPSYPNLPSKLICRLHSCILLVRNFLISIVSYQLTLYNFFYFLFDNKNLCYQADLESDEVYAQMTLQPVNKVRCSNLSY